MVEKADIILSDDVEIVGMIYHRHLDIVVKLLY